MHIRSEKTVLAVSNAITLVSSIVAEIAGEEVANTINGSEVTRAAMHDIIGSQINKHFSDFTNQGAK